MSHTEIERRTGISRRTISRYLKHVEDKQQPVIEKTDKKKPSVLKKVDAILSLFEKNNGVFAIEEIAETIGENPNFVEDVLNVMSKEYSGPDMSTQEQPVDVQKAQQQHEIEVDGNLAIASSKGADVKTLDELLAICQVDLSVWEVDHFVANKWQQAAIIDKKVIITPLWQIKAWLVRKKAVVTEFPSIQPINITCSRPKMALPQTMRNGYVELIFPDPHFGFLRNTRTGKLTPFHDRRAVDIVCQLAAILNPDGITGLGDTLDCPEFSDKFVKSPEFYFTLQPSIIEAAWVLNRLKQLTPNADKMKRKLLEGNHDKRIELALRNHLLAACDIKPANAPDHAPAAFSVPNLLNLANIGWEYVGPYPDGQVWYNDNLVAQHGDVVRSGSGGTVNAIIKETRVSVICGHIHRNEQVSVTRFGPVGPVTYTVVSCGTLARLDGVVPAAKSRNNWQQGCAVVYYEKNGDNQYFQIIPVPINGGRALWMDQVLVGRDYAGELSKETGWDFLS